MKKILTITVPVIVIIAAFIAVLLTIVVPNQKRNIAMKLIEAQDYESAYALLEEIGDYETIASVRNEREKSQKKTEHYADKDLYEKASALMESGSYEEAIDILWDFDYQDSSALLDQCYQAVCDEASYERFSNISIGDIYTMGIYEQNNVRDDGKEPIEWIVIDKKGAALMLIPKYGLDVREYHDVYEDTTWETCEIRRWLNGRFLFTAFTEEEKLLIRSVTVSADENPENNTPAGSDTTDRIFLLSYQEAEKYFPTEEERKIIPTAFALSRGAFTSKSAAMADGGIPGFWWLRSPGLNPRYAGFISTLGVMRTDGLEILSWDGLIRPAMWIEPVH